MTTPKAIRTALKDLPTGSEAYDWAYREAMERIKGQIPGSAVLAMRVLWWISFSARPLATLELQHALAVEIGEPAIDEENLPEIEDMVSVCAGLVTVDEESGTIRLVHYTTQEYFERTRSEWFPDAQTDIATTCVSYLLFDTFKHIGFCETDEGFESRLELNPLYDYAARNWGHHSHTVPTELELLLNRLFSSQAKMSSCSQAMMMIRNGWHYPDYSQDVPRNLTGVHIAAYLGLGEVVMTLIKNGHDLDLGDSDSRTPLSFAAENGHEAVVELLLTQAGVNPDSRDSISGQTPLSWATKKGHKAVVELLLAQDGVDPDAKGDNGRTPLSWAAQSGHGAVVELLLAQDGVNPDSNDIYGQTPLSWAAENGHGAVVELLLAQDGVDPDSKDSGGRTPLSWAAGKGHRAVVELLLAQDGVDPDPMDFYGQTPLSWAAKNGHGAVVELLLARDGVDPDSKNIYCQTPLSWAAENGHGAVVELLLAQDGVNPDSNDIYGQTPLSWAARNGHGAVVELLLARGAVNPDSKDNDGQTLLSPPPQFIGNGQ